MKKYRVGILGATGMVGSGLFNCSNITRSLKSRCCGLGSLAGQDVWRSLFLAARR
jgi:hypothetical protein